MKTKQTYDTPESKILHLDLQGVIATSPGFGEHFNDEKDEDEW